MNLNQHLLNYPTDRSKLEYFTDRQSATNIDMRLKHTSVLKVLKRQATALGLFEIADEFEELIGEINCVSAGGNHGLLK